jgi:predicted  nucleic acid-binding Zn-ribbon protein
MRAARDAEKAKEPELLAEARRIANERSRLEDGRRSLLDALQEGGVAANAIAGRLAELDEQLGQLETQDRKVTEKLAAISNQGFDEDELPGAAP